MTEKQLWKRRKEDNVWVETHAPGEVGYLDHNVEVIFMMQEKVGFYAASTGRH